MTRSWQATDGTHWASDTMMEQFGNGAKYNIVSACGYTPSGANLQVTVAAGVITHDGNSVAVAGNVVTLVADGTNPRWTWVAINSSGVAEIVSGTPSAEVLGVITATEPEVGDRVEVALFYVAAAATVASSQGNVDRRYFAPTAVDQVTGALTNDVNCPASTTLADISGLSGSLAANTTYMVRGMVHYVSAAAADYKLGFTVPSGATIRIDCMYVNTSGTATISAVTASGGSVSANGFGATTPGVIVFWGSIFGTYSAGNFQLQHAPVAVSGTSTTKAKSRTEVF